MQKGQKGEEVTKKKKGEPRETKQARQLQTKTRLTKETNGAK